MAVVEEGLDGHFRRAIVPKLDKPVVAACDDVVRPWLVSAPSGSGMGLVVVEIDIARDGSVGIFDRKGVSEGVRRPTRQDGNFQLRTSQPLTLASVQTAMVEVWRGSKLAEMFFDDSDSCDDSDAFATHVVPTRRLWRDFSEIATADSALFASQMTLVGEEEQ